MDNNCLSEIKTTKITKKEQDGTEFYVAEDLSLINSWAKNNKLLTIRGNAFIVNALESSYFHAMFDAIGQFLILRKILNNDLTLHLLFSKSAGENISKILNACILILKEQHNIEYSKIYMGDFEEIKFENAFFIDKSRLKFLDKEFDKLPVPVVSNTDVYKAKILQLYTDELSLAFSKYYSLNSPHRKIFLSRLKTSLQIRKDIECMLKMEELGLIKINNNKTITALCDVNKDIVGDTSNNFTDNAKQTVFDCVKTNGRCDLFDRYISSEDERKIEEYFIAKGYDIVAMESLEFYNQLWILSETSHFATLSGSNCVNTLFLPESAKVFIVNNNVEYDFPHNKYIDHRFNDARYIFNYKNKKDAITQYSADEIIEYLNNNYLREM